MQKGGVSYIVYIIVIAAAILLFVNFVVRGGDSILGAVGVQIDTTRNATENQSLTKAMQAQCKAKCTTCCSYGAEDTLKERTDRCQRVLRNQQFKLNDTTVNCDEFYDCECTKD